MENNNDNFNNAQHGSYEDFMISQDDLRNTQGNKHE